MPVQMRVHVPPHPLIAHWLGIARNEGTTGKVFRQGMAELGKWLTYEAIRDWLPTIEVCVNTPLGECKSSFIDPQTPLAIVPILRAGLTLLPGIEEILPLDASIFHLGLVRNEETLQPSCYVNKLPPSFPPNSHVIIAEPMLATGGSIMVAMHELTSRGVDPSLIRIISIVAAPPALKQLAENYPSLHIYTAMIDEEVNDRGFIVPGLGDVGDRSFGT